MKTTLFGAAIVSIAAGTANAATMVQMDVNGLTATTSGPNFGLNYTGSLTLSGDSGLFGMLVDGSSVGIGFNGPYTGTNFDLSATFTFNSGDITGIGLTVRTSSAMNGVLDDVYTAQILSGNGNILPDMGKPGAFIVAAQTDGGGFSDAVFGGVDVSDFLNTTLVGNFLNFKIDGGLVNNGSKTDPDVDIDIFVRNSVIPLPTPVGLASVGLLSLAAVRRRRA